MTVLRSTAILALALVLAGLPAGDAASDPTGIWATESGKSHVKIAPCEQDAGKLCGTIVWLADPTDDDGAPVRDKKNDDEALRDRPILGIHLLRDMEHQGGNEWDDGKIYNPEDGYTYSSEMELVDRDTLEVSGCILFICQAQTWKRVE